MSLVALLLFICLSCFTDSPLPASGTLARPLSIIHLLVPHAALGQTILAYTVPAALSTCPPTCCCYLSHLEDALPVPTEEVLPYQE